MPRDSNGNYTNANAPVNAGETILASTYNTENDDKANELTDSLSRSGKGDMLAQLRVVDGTLAAPGMAFASEPGSGLHRVGPGDVGLIILGQIILRALSSGDVQGLDARISQLLSLLPFAPAAQDFGMVYGGSSDQGPAINAALASGYGLVRIRGRTPKNEIVVATEIVVPGRVRLEGQHDFYVDLRWRGGASPANAIILSNAPAANDYVYSTGISRLRVDGESLANRGIWVKAWEENCDIFQVDVWNTLQEGIVIEAENAATETLPPNMASMNQMHVKVTSGKGIVLNGCRRTRITNATFSTSPSATGPLANNIEIIQNNRQLTFENVHCEDANAPVRIGADYPNTQIKIDTLDIAHPNHASVDQDLLVTTLAAAIDAVTTEVQIADSSKFPSRGKLRVDSEDMTITGNNRTTNTLTVTRGAPVSHALNAPASLRGRVGIWIGSSDPTNNTAGCSNYNLANIRDNSQTQLDWLVADTQSGQYIEGKNLTFVAHTDSGYLFVVGAVLVEGRNVALIDKGQAFQSAGSDIDISFSDPNDMASSIAMQYAGDTLNIRKLDGSTPGDIMLAISRAVNRVDVGSAFEFRPNGPLRHFGATIGFNGSAAVAKGDITGSRADGTALNNLLNYLQSRGDITNNTTA